MVTLLILGMSSNLASINWLCIIIYCRINGLLLGIAANYVVAILVTAVLLLYVLIVLAIVLIMCLLEAYCNGMLFNGMFGGDSNVYQHLFWVFGHPEVYIIIVPVIGCINNTHLMQRP